MKAAELLGSRVLDATGASIGQVVDLRLTWSKERKNHARLVVTAVVVDRRSWPHRWGFDDDRCAGPLLLGSLARVAARHARTIPVTDFATWEPGTVRLGSRT